MEFENLLTLIKTVSDSELTDFDYEENGTRIRLKKKKKGCGCGLFKCTDGTLALGTDHGIRSKMWICRW
ncbi:MAG: hypothetical protein ACLVB1_03900 [Blautia obeum]